MLTLMSHCQFCGHYNLFLDEYSTNQYFYQHSFQSKQCSCLKLTSLLWRFDKSHRRDKHIKPQQDLSPKRINH